MFNIVFSADNNYIKYVGVLINSIIKNTQTQRSFKDFCAREYELIGYDKLDFEALSDEEKREGYVFHILSEDISLENEQKLDALESKLCKTYPLKIKIYKNLGLDFGRIGSLGWGEGRNFTTYYRLVIPTLLRDCKTCLYLDVDMLINGDLRELFSLDLKGFALATVQNQPPFENVYNAGFLLFNLEIWRKEDLEQKCLMRLKEYPNQFDQGALNAVIKNENTLKIPLKYNFWLQTFQSDDYKIFQKEDFLRFKEHTQIIHYIRPKPWRSLMLWLQHSKNKVFFYQNIIDLWWECALKTPIFNKELQQKKIEMNNEFATNMHLYFNQLENTLKDQNSQIQTLQFHLNYGTASSRLKSHLAYKLGEAMIDNSKSLLGYIRMPYVLSYIKDKHNKEQKQYQEKIKKNPKLKLPPLESYSDYKESLKIKTTLSYKLGEALITANSVRGGG
ncbi:glycosyltransferase family 8 protein, partial [Helicobacter mesocricetorum]|uniref:glycosyltransferase family 8 protein n=1 Tax=Helicobacter mesocricetorum TaxID=87012 RepID=UPI000CF0350A